MGKKSRRPVAATRRYTGTDRSGVMLMLWCPGCDQLHAPSVEGTGPPIWQWDNNLESPTLSPSILITWTEGEEKTEHRCHSYLIAGNWQFLADSTHKLRSQTVPMVPLPKWVLKKDKA